MTRNKVNKQAELIEFRNLVLATIDYHLDNKLVQIKTAEFNSDVHFNELKKQTEEHFQKGRLTILKHWFRDLTEMQIETRDFKFNKYLQDKTDSKIDIFKNYFQRIDKIIAKGKITTDNQFYDINIFADHICQTDPVDKVKLEMLNILLNDFENRKSKEPKKPPA